MTNDPRGPERKIVNVTEVETPVPEGILYHVQVTLDCGHVKKPNPIFTYRVGERSRCFGCDR